MAGLNGKITIEDSEYRPCIVNGRKGLFHKWGFDGKTVGIVEFEGAPIAVVPPEKIQFLDSGNYFNRYIFWEPDMERLKRREEGAEK